MPKYVVNINGAHNVVTVVNGSGPVYIAQNQHIVMSSAPAPSADKRLMFKLLMEREDYLRDSPLFETDMAAWMEERELLNQAWERYHRMR